MLYSVAAAFAAYWAVIALIGALLSLKAVEAILLFFGIVCFGGAYFARSARPVRRLANTIGGICVALFLAMQFVLPILQGRKSLVIFASVVVGLMLYGITRRITFRRYVRQRRDGSRPAPPFGREWMRWLFAFIM